MKQIIGTVLAVAASALTILLVVLAFDLMTSEVDSQEQAAGKYVMVLGGLVTAALWFSAIALLQGARREKRMSDL